MANSRTLLVYVLALLAVCGSNSGFWVSASTAPLLGGSLVGNTAASNTSPQQTRPQHHYTQFQSPQHQKVPETSLSLPPPSQSSSLPPSSPSSPQLVPSSSSPSSQQQLQKQPTVLIPNNNNNAPSTYSVKNGFGFSTGNSRAGPYTSGYGYITGRTLNHNQPSHTYMTDYDLERPVNAGERAGPFTSGLQSMTAGGGITSLLTEGLNMKSVMIGALLGGIGATFLSPTRMFEGLFPSRSSVSRAEPKVKVPSISVPEAPPSPASEKAASPSPASEKAASPSPASEPAAPVSSALSSPSVPDATNSSSSSRQKRDVEYDTDLTELATMVLSAIQSGECMQRTICLLGSRIGSSDKGKMGFLLVDKLIPESVQGSQYFVTLKKALRGGESYCDRFRCRLN